MRDAPFPHDIQSSRLSANQPDRLGDRDGQDRHAHALDRLRGVAKYRECASLDFWHHGDTWTQPEVNDFIRLLLRV